MSKVKTSGNERAKRPHFNVLDALIILLVIIAVVGVYFRYSIIDLITSKDNVKEYVISFSIDDVRHTTPDYFKVGDEVYYDGELLGTLMNASKDNKEPFNITFVAKYFEDANGEVHKVFYPDMNNETRVNAKGRLLCEGSYTSEEGFYLGGNKYIAPGTVLDVKTELATVKIRVISIELYVE